MRKITFIKERFKDGEFIIKEGTWAYYAFVMEEGRANVMKGVDNRQMLIGRIVKGDIFGEMDFIRGSERTISVIADGDVTVNMFTRENFIKFFNKLPNEVKTGLSVMVKNLTMTTEIYSRLLVLFKDLPGVETNMLETDTFARAVEGLPEIMRNVAFSISVRHNIAIERLSSLIAQINARKIKLLPDYCGN